MGVDIFSKQKVLDEFTLWHNNVHIFWSNMIQQYKLFQTIYCSLQNMQNLCSELACYMTRKKNIATTTQQQGTTDPNVELNSMSSL